MIGIVDYGAGNIRSISNALKSVGAEIEIISAPEGIGQASAIVLPGVGSFGDGMKGLHNRGLVGALTNAIVGNKIPFLGICLGMQLIARESAESPGVAGLNWIDATVELMQTNDPAFKIPHMGWNSAEVTRAHAMYSGFDDAPIFYFVHSYHVVPRQGAEHIITSLFCHGRKYAASVNQENISAVQFHPEKSQADGIRLIRNFLTTVSES